jgi:hypothetical protein
MKTYNLIKIVCIFLILLCLSIPVFAEPEGQMKIKDANASSELDALTLSKINALIDDDYADINIIIDMIDEKYFNSKNTDYDKFSDAEKKLFKKAYDRWTEEHTFNGTTKMIYRSNPVAKSSNIIEYQIEEVFQSDDPKFKEMIGSDTLVSTSEKILIDLNTIDSSEKRLLFGSEFNQNIDFSKNISVTSKAGSSTEIITVTGDKWWLVSAYPMYLWNSSRVYDFSVSTPHTRKDPVNLIFFNTTASTAQAQIILGSALSPTDSTWVGAMTVEYPYQVFDTTGKWIFGNSVATDPIRANGGYHVRIYQLSNGSVVGGAHIDSGHPHSAINFEGAESKVAQFFNSSSYWMVGSNSTNLSNPSNPGEPFNNQWATNIRRIR